MTHNAAPPELDTNQDADHRVHDPIGAYILGALPDSEAAAFEAHLQDCQQCQRELYALGPLVAMLPRLYDDLEMPGDTGDTIEMDSGGTNHEDIEGDAVVIETETQTDSTITEPPTIAGVDQSVEAAVPELEDPVLPDLASPAMDEAIEAAEASDAAELAEAAAEATALPATPRRRPRGRIAPGEAPPEAAVVSIPRERRSLIPWVIAAGSVILAVGAMLWALAMMGQIDELKSERDLQDRQVAQLNQEREDYLAQTPALIHPLISTTAGSTGISGTVYLDPDPAGGGGIVTFQGLAQPPSGQVYQIWTIVGGEPAPGPTFVPDAEGNAIVQIGKAAVSAEQMAITIEPSGGSKTPTTSPIMQGNLQG